MTERNERQQKLLKIAEHRQQIQHLQRELEIGRQECIDEENRIEEQEAAAYRLVARFATDLITVHAPNGDYLFASRNAERFFGWRPEQLLECNAYDFFHPEDLERISGDHAGHHFGERGRVRYRLRCADGSYIWVETRSRARSTNGSQEIVAITSNIEEQLEAQRQADAAREALLSAERARSMANLARAIAHEINNPLAACRGHLQLAISQAKRQPDTDQLVELLEKTRHGANRIEGFVSELQMLSKEMSSAGERLDLREVVERVAALVPPELRPYLTLDLDPVEVYADRPRLYQLVYNLIMPHLLAERPDGAQGAVEVCSRAADEDHVRLQVTGGEIPRSSSRTDLLAVLRGARTPSTLPFSLARELVDEMGGRWEESDLGEDRYCTAALLPRRR